jgi:hypothetical protein
MSLQWQSSVRLRGVHQKMVVAGSRLQFLQGRRPCSQISVVRPEVPSNQLSHGISSELSHLMNCVFFIASSGSLVNFE